MQRLQTVVKHRCPPTIIEDDAVDASERLPATDSAYLAYCLYRDPRVYSPIAPCDIVHSKLLSASEHVDYVLGDQTKTVALSSVRNDDAVRKSTAHVSCDKLTRRMLAVFLAPTRVDPFADIDDGDSVAAAFTFQFTVPEERGKMKGAAEVLQKISRGTSARELQPRDIYVTDARVPRPILPIVPLRGALIVKKMMQNPTDAVFDKFKTWVTSKPSSVSDHVKPLFLDEETNDFTRLTTSATHDDGVAPLEFVQYWVSRFFDDPNVASALTHIATQELDVEPEAPAPGSVVDKTQCLQKLGLHGANRFGVTLLSLEDAEKWVDIMNKTTPESIVVRTFSETSSGSVPMNSATRIAIPIPVSAKDHVHVVAGTAVVVFDSKAVSVCGMNRNIVQQFNQGMVLHGACILITRSDQITDSVRDAASVFHKYWIPAYNNSRTISLTDEEDKTKFAELFGATIHLSADKNVGWEHGSANTSVFEDVFPDVQPVTWLKDNNAVLGSDLKKFISHITLQSGVATIETTSLTQTEQNFGIANAGRITLLAKPLDNDNVTLIAAYANACEAHREIVYEDMWPTFLSPPPTKVPVQSHYAHVWDANNKRDDWKVYVGTHDLPIVWINHEAEVAPLYTCNNVEVYTRDNIPHNQVREVVQMIAYASGDRDLMGEIEVIGGLARVVFVAVDEGVVTNFDSICRDVCDMTTPEKLTLWRPLMKYSARTRDKDVMFTRDEDDLLIHVHKTPRGGIMATSLALWFNDMQSASEPKYWPKAVKLVKISKIVRNHSERNTFIVSTTMSLDTVAEVQNTMRTFVWWLRQYPSLHHIRVVVQTTLNGGKELEYEWQASDYPGPPNEETRRALQHEFGPIPIADANQQYIRVFIVPSSP